MSQQNGHRRVQQHVARRTAKDHLAQAAAAESTHDYEAGTTRYGLSLDVEADAAGSCLALNDSGVSAVLRQISQGSRADFGIGLEFAQMQDFRQLGLGDQFARSQDRSACLERSIERKKNLIAESRRDFSPGDKDRTAKSQERVLNTRSQVRSSIVIRFAEDDEIGKIDERIESRERKLN